ncbi:MAG TPA: GNAT family N-acetyltransferase [Iamia sp.]|nr:GNAT family N-acetyltransferase [Iamia sp.]
MRARLLDEIAANATPAPITRLVDGWLAKCAPGLPFRRANAVLPAAGAGADPERTAAVLDELTDWYGTQGRRLVVQVPSTDPALDSLLASRGLVVEAPVDVLVATPVPVIPVGGVEAAVAVGVDAAWAAEYGAVHGEDAASRARVEAYGRMLADLGPSAVAAVARRSGEVAGVGFGVRERGWLGVFGMGTAVAHRRHGVARAVLGVLASGRDAYLQVEVGNAPAQALYRGLGFTDSHRYHYRVTA